MLSVEEQNQILVEIDNLQNVFEKFKISESQETGGLSYNQNETSVTEEVILDQASVKADECASSFSDVSFESIFGLGDSIGFQRFGLLILGIFLWFLKPNMKNIYKLYK